MHTSLHKRLFKYHHKRWKHIRASLKDFLKKGADEDLHELRVEIKQLTSLYHFIESCDLNFNGNKLLKPIEKIFKLSGKVRDYRNAKQFCNKYKIEQKAFRNEAKKQEDYLEQLQQKHKRHTLDFKKLENKTNHELRGIGKEQIKNYLRVKRQEAITDLGKKSNDKALHEVRKKIKELCYIANISSFERKGICNAQDLKKLDKLQDDIGNWHDISKFSQKLQGFFKAKQSRLPQAIAREEQRLLKEIRKNSAEFIQAQSK